MLYRMSSAFAITFVVLMGLLVLMPNSTLAQDIGGDRQERLRRNCVQSSERILGFPTWYKYLNPQVVGGECKIDAPFPESIGKILLAVFEILLRLAGVLAIIFTIWGGFQYILSQGEPERSSQARSSIINALIGLAIAISAVAIVNLVGRNLT
jgi:hypothetical protein